MRLGLARQTKENFNSSKVGGKTTASKFYILKLKI